jgi:hypothetical protein
LRIPAEDRGRREGSSRIAPMVHHGHRLAFAIVVVVLVAAVWWWLASA